MTLEEALLAADYGGDYKAACQVLADEVRRLAGAVAAERERWEQRLEVLVPYGGGDGRRDWASAGAWLYPGDALAVVRSEPAGR